MKLRRLVFLLLIATVFGSCSGGRLNRSTALDIINRDFPIDTNWQTKKIYKSWLNLNYYEQNGIIHSLLVNNTPGADGIGIPVNNPTWDDYELTDKGRSLVINNNLNDGSIIAKTHYISGYNVNTVYFATDGANEAQVEFQVFYAATPFSGLNILLHTRSTGAPDGKGNEINEYSYYPAFVKSIKCTFKKFDTGWEIDDKQAVAEQIKSLDNITENATGGGQAVIIRTVTKLPIKNSK